MDYYVWITYRRIRPGSREGFEASWEPADFPDGLLRADAWYGEGGDEIVGVSFWESREACDRYRSSDVEARRREAMASFVLDERSETYTGRQLAIPGR